jgi:signal transduction histidine kinase/CheY-like chemotaxis protein
MVSVYLTVKMLNVKRKEENLMRKICFLLLAAFLIGIAGCVDLSKNQADEVVRFSSFRDVPGVTHEEIKAVEDLLEKTDSFNYAMMYSTSAFYFQNGRNGNDGEIRGYSALVCEWLTELFGVPFVLEHYTWNEILDGLDDMSIDFTGTITPTEERQRTYFMTDPIAQRSIKYFHLAGYEKDESRLPRYALLEGAVSSKKIIEYAIYDFEPVFVSEYIDAHDLLVSGEIDALLAENTVEAIFDSFNNVVSEPFFPLLYTPVSMTAKNPELEPILKVVQKILESDGKRYLDELFDAGNREYLSHKLFLQLTDEELDFIKNTDAVLFGAEYANYPISFYNKRHEEWQGIAYCVLGEITELTGLNFEIANDEQTQFYDLLDMLQAGEIHMVSEIIETPERQGLYIWPENALMIDRSVLISKVTYPNINMNRVYSARVGLSKGSAYTEFFFKWFPNHGNYVIYDSQQATFDALVDGEVDLVMNSYSTLLNLTNYQELPDYKANIIFDNDYSATFGINKDQQILCSVIDKSLELIDTEIISEHWKNRTYDYQLRLIQAQRPWIIGASILLLFVLLLVVALWVRSRRTGIYLENLVEKRTQQLALANQHKSSFLANMSHEIRTPMNAILGITEILIKKENLPEEIEVGLYKMYSSCDLLLGIINDILDLSKIEAGKLDIIPRQYSTASLLNDSIQLNLMRLESKPIVFEVDVNKDVPANLIGDELRIKQILNNLLSNAFKYTKSGKITLSVSHNGELDELVVSVRDTGQGMSEEQLKKLFDEYSRFNNKTNTNVEGTGLGLAITNRLINLMEGKIHVESEPGVGSLFTISFPQGKVDDEVIGREVADNLRRFRIEGENYSRRGQVSREAMPYGKVLVVDDVETNLFVAVGLMKPYELNIETVSSGFEALGKIKSGESYDIVFMDHMMPKMDGIETTSLIRRLGYNAPIVALTANAVAGQSEMFLKNGFDDFVSKPIDVRQLNSILNKYVRDKNGKGARGGKASYSSDGEVKTKSTAFSSGLDMKSIKGINLKKGLARFDNNEAVYVSILRSYVASVREIVADIEKVSKVDEGNVKSYKINVHSIKGTSYDIFINEIGDMARALEEAAKNNDFDFINSNTSALVKEMNRLIHDLEEALLVIESENPKPKKAKPDTEALSKLLTACKTYSMDGADAAMAELEKFSYEEDDGLVVWLREKLDTMGFDEITERLSQLNEASEG